MSEKPTSFTMDALSAHGGDRKLPDMADYGDIHHPDDPYRQLTQPKDMTDYVDTSVRPYEAEADLSGLPTTSFEMKGKAYPSQGNPSLPLAS
ncbi:MAG: hypothetical protein WAQ24_03570 [Candidatus Saccharimonadales bacterium]